MGNISIMEAVRLTCVIQQLFFLPRDLFLIKKMLLKSFKGFVKQVYQSMH